MERTGLLEVGDVLPVTESKLPNSWYQTLGRAYAMSANYEFRERLKSREGTVVEVKETPKGYYVIVEFDEQIYYDMKGMYIVRENHAVTFSKS